MYGTVARMRVKSGMEEKLWRLSREFEAANVPGYLFEYAYRTDANPREYYLVVGFESKEAYEANAKSPEMHQRYLAYREFLEADPEWHDGEIAYASHR